MYTTWPAEIKKWIDFEGLTYAILHGSVKEWNLDCDVDIYIINPEGLPWLLSQQVRPSFDVLAIDESSKFKDSSTKRFKLLKPWLASFKRRWILTGTPSPNGLEDLFGQIYILDLGRSLGRFITHFRNEFFTRAPWNVYQWLPKPDSFQTIIQRIAPLILQLSAEDHLKMPELMYFNISVLLPKEAVTIYRQMEKDYISDDIVASTAAVAGVKCRQIANGAVYEAGEGRKYRVIHDAKLDALEGLLEEMAGRPILLLYEFNHDKERIRARFPQCEMLGENASEGELNRVVDGFNSGKIQILLGHPASMGHGLNLQGSCHTVIWFGVTWNLEYYDQAIARVYRQGQRSDRVSVYHLVATGTLDEEVLEVLTKKDRTQQDLLAAISRERLLEHIDGE